LPQVEPFHGQSAALAAEFLGQLAFFFAYPPQCTMPDKDKIAYAIVRLRGRAHAWVRPYLSRDPRPAWLSDFDIFTTEFSKRFLKPNRSYNTSAHLKSLQQTGSVDNYAIEFRQGAAVLDWPDPPLMDLFYDGLKDAIKDELIRAPRPADLESLIQLATDFDIRLQERFLARGRGPRPSRPPPSTSYPHPRSQAAPPPATISRGPATASDPDARPQNRDPTSTRHHRLTDEEKEYRRKNNLCLFCGSPGHIVRECPECPSNRQSPAHAKAARVPSRPSGNALAQQQ